MEALITILNAIIAIIIGIKIFKLIWYNIDSDPCLMFMAAFYGAALSTGVAEVLLAFPLLNIIVCAILIVETIIEIIIKLRDAFEDERVGIIIKSTITIILSLTSIIVVSILIKSQNWGLFQWLLVYSC